MSSDTPDTSGPLRSRLKTQPVERKTETQAHDSEAPPSLPAAEQPSRGRIRMPSRHAAMPAELQRELDSALGEVPVDQLLEKTEKTLKTPELEPESRVRAQVVRVHRDNVFFSLGGRNEGIAPVRQFKEPPQAGNELEVVITGFLPEDGLYEVTVPGASVNVGDWSDVNEGTLVEARVTGANTGGLECMVNHIRAFIPASQVAIYRVENLAELVDQKMLCVVTEANPDRRNLVLSRRAVLEREKEEARQKLLEEIKEGDVREGVVRNIRDFGAFVDLGGVDGLLHVSQLSWDRVNHPSDVLEEGQRVKVRVEKIDRQTGKLSLSYRSLQEHPWERAEQQFPVGSIVKGTVSRLAKFGAFVKLAPGIEGLVHISEISHQRVNNVANVLREGQEVDVKVVSLEVENQRIGLSIKALQNVAPPPAEEEPEAEEAPTKAAPKPRGPLKGGVDKSTGGEAFGLKW
jgi:small subunit ribosomal protein S1